MPRDRAAAPHGSTLRVVDSWSLEMAPQTWITQDFGAAGVLPVLAKCDRSHP
jgi:hypothetical protein